MIYLNSYKADFDFIKPTYPAATEYLLYAAKSPFKKN